MGLGGGDAVKGFVEEGDDALLRRNVVGKADAKVISQFRAGQLGLTAATFATFLNLLLNRNERVAKEFWIKESIFRSNYCDMGVYGRRFNRCIPKLGDSPQCASPSRVHQNVSSPQKLVS